MVTRLWAGARGTFHLLFRGHFERWWSVPFHAELVACFVENLDVSKSFASHWPWSASESRLELYVFVFFQLLWKKKPEDSLAVDIVYGIDITARIIAMSYPSDGFESIYRNSLKDVKRYIFEYPFCRGYFRIKTNSSTFRFLDARHKGHYKIFNL